MKKKVYTFGLASILGTASLFTPFMNNTASAETSQQKQEIQQKRSEVNSGIKLSGKENAFFRIIMKSLSEGGLRESESSKHQASHN